jgi:hypothetical protein
MPCKARQDLILPALWQIDRLRLIEVAEPNFHTPVTELTQRLDDPSLPIDHNGGRDRTQLAKDVPPWDRYSMLSSAIGVDQICETLKHSYRRISGIRQYRALSRLDAGEKVEDPERTSSPRACGWCALPSSAVRARCEQCVIVGDDLNPITDLVATMLEIDDAYTAIPLIRRMQVIKMEPKAKPGRTLRDRYFACFGDLFSHNSPGAYAAPAQFIL